MADHNPIASKECLDPGIVTNPPISEPWTVDKVVASISPEAPKEDTDSPIPFFHMLERLKTNKREGWRRFGIERGESISDHMYRMSLISMLCPPSLSARVDLSRCIKMCLIHDMAEALVGDITPVDGVPKPEKSRREAETMDYVAGKLLGKVGGGGDSAGAAGREIRAIWQEYEDSKTLESQFVHDVDKVELLLQMVEYEKRCAALLDLGEFAYVATRVQLPEVRAWADELLRERDAFWGAKARVQGQKVEGEAESGVGDEKREAQEAYYAREGDGEKA